MCKTKILRICAIIISTMLVGEVASQAISTSNTKILEHNMIFLNRDQQIETLMQDIIDKEYADEDEETKETIKGYIREILESYSIYITNQTYNLYKDVTSKAVSKRIEEEELKRLEEEAKRQEAEARALQLEQERIANVKFNSWDITDISGITHDEMYNVLAYKKPYSNFLEIANAFVDAERTYGVNAFALAAIAGVESGWNTSNRAKNGSNNITGMAVYNNVSRGTVYSSKYECIMDLAKQLNTYYLNPNGRYYNGTSTSKVNIKYCASPDWYKKIDALGDELMAIYERLYK